MKKIFLLLLFFTQLSFAQASESPGTVVCLHGFMRNYKCFIPIGNQLISEGFKVYLWDYPSRRETIEGHADNLVEVLQHIAKERPGEPIHFVTHSLGGVIVRTAVSHPKCPHEAKMGKAILLGPPNQGSSLARRLKHFTPMQWIFGPKAGAQLLNYSEEEMDRLGSFPETMEVLVIAGHKGNGTFFEIPNDGKVSVPETRLNTPHHFLCVFAAHSWIMTSRQTMSIMKHFLLSD